MIAAWAGTKFAQFLLGEAQDVQHFVLFPLVVVVERLLEMMADADVIDDKALVLGGPADAIHAGDGLEEAVRDDDLVEIHDLLDRRIKAGQEHVVDDHDAHVAVDTPSSSLPKGSLKLLMRGLVLCAIRVGLQMQFVVVAAGDNHVGLQLLEAARGRSCRGWTSPVRRQRRSSASSTYSL